MLEGTISQEAFEAVLTRKCTDGTLQLYNLVPATFAAWPPEAAVQRVSVDHAHLPSGESLTFAAEFIPETQRVDTLLLCPSLANEIRELSARSMVLMMCLN